MNKKERLEKIRRFVLEYSVGTQEEIVQHLAENGISATQATVSRDIKELGIVKIPLKNNAYIYELPKSAVSNYSLSENNVLEVRTMDKMISMIVVPGSAAFIKSKFLENYGHLQFSTLNDDDSILIHLYKEISDPDMIETITRW